MELIISKNLPALIVLQTMGPDAALSALDCCHVFYTHKFVLHLRSLDFSVLHFSYLKVDLYCILLNRE